jgi:RNA polymerase sigma-70 factor (ECF subfamily)
VITFAGEGIGDASLSRAAPGSVRPVVSRRSDGFAECYEHSYTALTKQLYLYTGDLGLAQDLVQEAFCRALPRWSKVSTYDDPVAWIRRVAFNLANSRWQRAKVAARYLRGQREQHARGPNPDRVAAVAALGTLPARQRRVVVLYYLADRSVAEIAAEEGVPAGTVKTWLSRGRAALAGLLAEEERHV